MTSLRERHTSSGHNEQSVKVGDIVLVHDNIPIAKWKMAVVEQLLQGKDGYTRAANIRYSGGKTNRPIAKLYPLEVSSINSDHVQDTTTDTATVSQLPGDIPVRPTRNSAAKARQNIDKWTRLLLSPAPEDVED